MKQNEYTNQMCPARHPEFDSNVRSFVKVMQTFFFHGTHSALVKVYKTSSPEEHGAGWMDKLDLPQIDTFMMANVMFYVLTKLWMWEGIATKKAIRLTAQGVRPKIPVDILISEDAATKAMVKAIKNCWIHDPKKRPRSRQVSDYLNEELRKIEGVEELGVVRVSIPPLAKSHRFTDTDFYDNFLL
jgi:hypothetical protein